MASIFVLANGGFIVAGPFRTKDEAEAEKSFTKGEVVEIRPTDEGYEELKQYLS